MREERNLFTVMLLKTDNHINFSLISDILIKYNVFTVPEIEKLLNLQKKYTQNISQLTEAEYKKELERL